MTVTRAWAHCVDPYLLPLVCSFFLIFSTRQHPDLWLGVKREAPSTRQWGDYLLHRGKTLHWVLWTLLELLSDSSSDAWFLGLQRAQGLWGLEVSSRVRWLGDAPCVLRSNVSWNSSDSNTWKTHFNGWKRLVNQSQHFGLIFGASIFYLQSSTWWTLMELWQRQKVMTLTAGLLPTRLKETLRMENEEKLGRNNLSRWCLKPVTH